ncbi:uncharacterized protein [Temnothorax longispinosus]|uniref:uncharacterized protein isoform X2 n=1 Tax=Temnothorax longispinosus TaxID=300112 RepID=UPI003A9986F9
MCYIKSVRNLRGREALGGIGRRSNTGSKRGPSSRSGLHANARALMVAIRTYQLDRNSRDKLPRLQSRASRRRSAAFLKPSMVGPAHLA